MKPGFALAAAALALSAFPALALADDAPVEAPVGSDLNAGGLKPPAPIETTDTNAPPSQPEAQLARADKEDSGRGLEFVWLNGEVGAEYLGLETFKSKQLVDGGPVAKSKGLGAAYGAGLGARLLAFTFGARFRFANFEDYQLWTLNAEAGFHIPLGRLEPYGTLGVGYASLGDFKHKDRDPLTAPVDLKANGLDARIGAGLDYYVTNTLSVGANLTGEVLFLGRSAYSGSQATQIGSIPLTGAYSQHGSGIGLGGTLSAVVGLHF